jgi:chemotaxis protein methyltransferase CheR
MAILLREEGLLERTIIYATDINPRSLEKAKQGIFSLESVRAYTHNYQQAGGQRSFPITTRRPTITQSSTKLCART